ncbi:MAG TPA: hypothetical protein VGE08_24520 [Steroidobacter sp.]|uniref:hypothetical protein n=1 Tax=Steroidobacter sp. TaxID=1978227 RepID=UPI002EDACAF8
MKTKVTLLAIAWLASGVALAADTAPNAPYHGTRGPNMDRMALLLDLDAYQKTEVEKILKAHHEQRRAQFEAAKASGTRPSREEMKAMHEQGKQELNTKLSGVLNETQMKKFEALRERGPGAGRHFKRRHGRGDGESRHDSSAN